MLGNTFPVLNPISVELTSPVSQIQSMQVDAVRGNQRLTTVLVYSVIGFHRIEGYFNCINVNGIGMERNQRFEFVSNKTPFWVETLPFLSIASLDSDPQW